MLRMLTERENALLSVPGAAAFGHRPAAFAAAALGDAGLARRLEQVAALPGHSGAVNALAWTEGGELLASGGEDCRLRLWRGASGELLHSLDTGHTATILSSAFLPGSRGDQLLCCSADRQIRHIAVTKGAVRPYLVHAGRVRAVQPLDAHVFLSASEDGTVREFDVRQRPAAVHRDALAGDDSNVLVDQRAERIGRSRVRVGIYSLAVDTQRPWLMVTGGTDPLLRMYDRRMLPDGEGGKASQWMAAYVPSHIKSALLDSGRHPALVAGSAALAPAGRHVTAVAFARGGTELVGAYSGECIYSFDAAQHARDVEALLHIPETVLRAPARPRSHTGRRSMRGTGGNQDPAGHSPAVPAALAAAAAAAAAAVAVEGGGGTAPSQAQAERFREAQQPHLTHQRARPLAGRGIAIASSVRQLERQRRQQSRVVAAEPPRAESSRPAHWQLHPTSSTLRSPHNAGRLHHGQQQQQQQPHNPHHRSAHHPSPHRHHHNHHPPSPQQQQQQQQLSQQHDSRQAPLELVSDSEGVSEGAVSPECHQQRPPGVRRSRRIMRRQRDAAEAAAELQHMQEGSVHEAGTAKQQGQQQQQEPLQLHQELEAQQPAVSGVAEPAQPVPASSSDSEDPEAHGPATRRRVWRRTLAGSAADGHAADAAAAAAAQQQQSSGLGAGAGAAAGAAAEVGSGGDGFKAPPGRSPPQPPRRQVAAAAAAMQRLDSTVGLLHQHAPQLEASEVAAGAQHAQQEATVSMRHAGQHTAAGRRGGAALERSPAMEVSSRPVLSASQVGLATQLGSQQAGHEASSLNSAEQPANERVGSVVQRPRADAPSVGNAPLATTAAARGAAAGARTAGEREQEVQQQPPPQAQAQAQGMEVQEASTGHHRGGRASGARLLPPPPQFGPELGARQRQQLQPTASTGTSHPPAFSSQHQHQQQQQQRYLPPAASGRQASRLRRHSEVLHASQQAAAGVGSRAAAAGTDGGRAPPAAAPEQQAGQPHSAAAQPAPSQLQQPQPQATMLSGRGPSVLGDFMPGQQEQLADSEILQQQRQEGSVGAERGQRGEAQQQHQQQRHHRRRQVDSNVGAIVHNTDADDGEEVSEPTMFRRRYAGHLNLSPAAAHDGPPLAPQLAFLGLHSELLVSPSDCGGLFVWDYASGRLVAVLPPTMPAASSSSSLPAGAAAACTCVAPHPLLPVLASGGADSVVRMWSPEAEAACNQELAAAAVGANLQALADAAGLAGGGADGGSGADGLVPADPASLLLPGSPCTFM